MRCLPCFFLPLAGFEKGVCKLDEAFGSKMAKKGASGCLFALGVEASSRCLYAEPLSQQAVAVEAHTQPGAVFRGDECGRGRGGIVQLSAGNV